MSPEVRFGSFFTRGASSTPTAAYSPKVPRKLPYPADAGDGRTGPGTDILASVAGQF
jgi:hypothetical protein